MTIRLPAAVARDARPDRLCNLDRLIATMAARNLDGVVAYLRQNVFYLSGFAPPSAQSFQEGSGYAAVVINRHRPEDAVVVVADYGFSFFRDQPTWIADIRPYSMGLLPESETVRPELLANFVEPDILASPWGARAAQHYRGGFLPTLRRALTDLGLDRGRVGLDAYHLSDHLDLGAELVNAYGLFRHVRQVKTEAEIALLRGAAAINEKALTETVRSWQRGMSWRELTLTYNAIATSLDGYVHDPGGIIVANPPDGSPVYHATSGLEDFEITPGMSVMLDAHGIWNRYHWDGGKTWFVDDDPTPEAARMSAASCAAMRAMQASMRHGTKASDVVAVGREVLRKHGVPAVEDVMLFCHSVGLDLIDLEHDVESHDWPIERNMVVATHIVHPGDVRARYYLEGIAAVRDDGGESLFGWDYDHLRAE